MSHVTWVLGTKLVLLTTEPSFTPHFLSYLFNLCISCPLQWHRNPSRTGVVHSLYLMLPPQSSKQSLTHSGHMRNSWIYKISHVNILYSIVTYSISLKKKCVPPLPFSKLTAIYESIQLISPELFPSFINSKSMWILCLQSACPLWEWKMNVYQRLVHLSTACIQAHHSSHKGLVYVLFQTLTNISWRQTLQANTLDRDSSLKNIVHTSWSGRCHNLLLTAEGAECPNTH